MSENSIQQAASVRADFAVDDARLPLIRSRGQRMKRLFNVTFKERTNGLHSGQTSVSLIAKSDAECCEAKEYINALQNPCGEPYELPQHIRPSDLEEIERRFQVAVVVDDATGSLRLLYGDCDRLSKVKDYLKQASMVQMTDQLTKMPMPSHPQVQPLWSIPQSDVPPIPPMWPPYQAYQAYQTYQAYPPYPTFPYPPHPFLPFPSQPPQRRENQKKEH